jgi:hypothetical protein
MISSDINNNNNNNSTSSAAEVEEKILNIIVQKSTVFFLTKSLQNVHIAVTPFWTRAWKIFMDIWVVSFERLLCNVYILENFESRLILIKNINFNNKQAFLNYLILHQHPPTHLKNLHNKTKNQQTKNHLNQDIKSKSFRGFFVIFSQLRSAHCAVTNKYELKLESLQLTFHS